MLSEEIHVLLGLHQGSVLSPHLFDRIMDNNLKKWTFELMCYLHKLSSIVKWILIRFRLEKKEVKKLEEEMKNLAVVVDHVTGTNSTFEPDKHTYAVLRGKTVRYLMNFRDVSNKLCKRKIFYENNHQ